MSYLVGWLKVEQIKQLMKRAGREINIFMIEHVTG